jgi:CRISPR/Cas system CMR-associated protein Cmr1 (group 7 of RAMP superfamily)
VRAEKYVQLEKSLFQGQSDEYVCKVAKTSEEAIPLLEEGFTEASDFDGVKIYRKPKNLVHLKA